MENLMWAAAIAAILTDYLCVRIDQRRNYRRFSAWLDAQQPEIDLAHIEELERRYR